MSIPGFSVNSMRSWRSLVFAASAALFCWLAFVATQYARHQIRMRGIASELHMEYRSFHVLPGPIEPSSAIEGEERLLVVGKSADDFLLCSIVRNPQYTDWRGQWKVDICYRPDLQPEHPRLAIWQTMDHFPSDADLDRFRSDASQQPWVIWDTPEGTNPNFGD